MALAIRPGSLPYSTLVSFHALQWLLTLSLRVLRVALPFPRFLRLRLSLPFTTPYSQTRDAVDNVISSAENANNLPSRQHVHVHLRFTV